MKLPKYVKLTAVKSDKVFYIAVEHIVVVETSVEPGWITIRTVDGREIDAMMSIEEFFSGIEEAVAR